MRNVAKSMLAAAVAAVGFGSTASAISVSMSDVLQGYLGPITIKYTGYNEGTIYQVADGTYTGQGTLDGLSQIRPSNPVLPDDPTQYEDSWTVFKITSILDDQNNTLFTDNALINGNRYEITGIVWGENDVYLKQDTVGSSVNQIIRGAGLQFAFWIDENPVAGGTRFTVPGAPTDRSDTTGYVFPNVNEDLLIWTGVSAPLDPVNDPSYDFETSVVLTGSTVTGGSGGKTNGDWGTNDAGTGAWNGGFATIGSPDFTIRFTIDTTQNRHGFTTVVNDPLYTVAVPTPTSVAGGAMLAALGAIRALRRRRAQ